MCFTVQQMILALYIRANCNRVTFPVLAKNETRPRNQQMQSQVCFQSNAHAQIHDIAETSLLTLPVTHRVASLPKKVFYLVVIVGVGLFFFGHYLHYNHPDFSHGFFFICHSDIIFDSTSIVISHFHIFALDSVFFFLLISIFFFVFPFFLSFLLLFFACRLSFFSTFSFSRVVCAQVLVSRLFLKWHQKHSKKMPLSLVC